MANEQKELERKQSKLLAAVKKSHGRIGNITLKNKLKWSDNTYWEVRNSLVNTGALVLGKGKGGSVRLPEEEQPHEASPEQQDEARIKEAGTYQKIKQLLEKEWVKDQRFNNSLVYETAHQGRRSTGGKWTRPDLIVISLTKFLYVPKPQFEVITFEVKTFDNIDITAVFEALAHSKNATRSYVLLYAEENQLQSSDGCELLSNIGDEAKRHGIGLVTLTDLNNYGAWEERVEAKFHEPSPAALHDFISSQTTQDIKDTIGSWL